MAKTELRPCPFCGKTPAYGKVLFGMEKLPKYTVHCENCSFNIGWFEEKEEALKKWDTRAEVEQMADVEKVIKGLEHCGQPTECDGCPYKTGMAGGCFTRLKKDALELLKAQTSIEPIRDSFLNWHCGNCRREIDRYEGDVYCPGCGMWKEGEMGMSIQVNDFRWEPGKNDAEYIKLLKSSRDEWQKIAQKAIAKLETLSRAQKPRVLTLEEVEDALDTVVWVDRPQAENSSDEYALISAYSHALGWGELKFVDGGTWHWMYKQYGKNLRCWSTRPTDEQREAVKWSD